MTAPTLRLATYNVEWFNALFDDAGGLLNDDSWSARWNVTKADQTAALGTVFQALDADGVMVIEAPDTSRKRQGSVALANFAERFGLRAREVVMGFANDTQQEIAFLYDPDVMTAVHAPIGDLSTASPAPRFDAELRIDLDTDADLDVVKWSKPPLELQMEAFGQTLRLIGVHAKSKAPHGAGNDAEATRIAIQNRRKQLAQCIWLRQRVNQHMDAGDALIVMGDFNDGPGLDEFEKLFGKSGIEVVLGEEGQGPLYDPHAAQVLSRRIAAAPATARFAKRNGTYLNALLDYVMVSPQVRDAGPHWQIWHPFDHQDCYANLTLREALLTASDHFPVSLTLPMGFGKSAN